MNEQKKITLQALALTLALAWIHLEITSILQSRKYSCRYNSLKLYMFSNSRASVWSPPHSKRFVEERIL